MKNDFTMLSVHRALSTAETAARVALESYEQELVETAPLENNALYLRTRGLYEFYVYPWDVQP